MSKKEKLVSVIVPIYNRESLMQKCVDSILNQTYKNIEVILVDDHSSDNSYKVMKEYTKKDSRVKAYTYKENKGAGHARNVGLDNATGAYIIFVDSDDYIDNDYVETLVNHIGDADMICCGHRDEYVDDNIVKEYKLCNNSLSYLEYGVIWSRMYTLSSINKNNTRFSLLKNSQDTRFMFEYIIYTNKIVTIAYMGYNRVIHNKDRLTPQRKVNSDRFINVMSDIDNVLSESTSKNKYKKELYYFIMKEFINSVWVISKKENYTKLLDEYNIMFNFMKKSFDKHNVKIHLIESSDLKLLFVAINAYVLCYKFHMTKLYLKLMNLRYKEK